MFDSKAKGALRFAVAVVVAAVLQGCASTLDEPTDTLVLEDGTVFVGDATDRGAVQEALLVQFRQWRGTPYKLGGNSKAGIDCSAFVQQTLATQFGIQAPRTTSQQLTMGEEVDRSAPKVGDLLFFRTGYTMRHVGFYLGGGQFLHASTKVGVTISKLDDPYWRKTFWKVRRVM